MDSTSSVLRVGWPVLFLFLTLAGAVSQFVGPRFISERPNDMGITRALTPDDDGIFSESKLWQDPLGMDFLQPEPCDRNSTTAVKTAQECPGTHARIQDIDNLIDEASKTESKQIMVVLMPGGSSPMPVEQRIRIRHAVLNALGRSYGPHTTLTQFNTSGTKNITGSYELLQLSRFTDGWRSTSSSRHERSSAPNSLPKTIALFYVAEDELLEPGRSLQFDSQSTSDSEQSSVTEFMHNLRRKVASDDNITTFSVIGPTQSDTLRKMLPEVYNCPNLQAGTVTSGTESYKVHYYSSSITPPAWIFAAAMTSGSEAFCIHRSTSSINFQPAFESKNPGATLTLPAISDDRLSGLLADEIASRTSQWYLATASATSAALRLFPQTTKTVVLISEWDTFYGRALPYMIRRSLKNHDLEVRHLNYMAQLDGGRSGHNQRQNEGENRNAAPHGPTWFSQSLTGYLERPEGPAQLDNLMRLTVAVKGLQESGKEIAAIGVVGSDIFDKLLVLQALRPQFPELLFFTTDMDAWMLHKSQTAWTKNLLVASAYGLTPDGLSSKSQPYHKSHRFRDTYQTATWHAVRQALGFSAEAPTPKLYEIGRYGEQELSISENVQLGQEQQVSPRQPGNVDPMPSNWKASAIIVALLAWVFASWTFFPKALMLITRITAPMTLIVLCAVKIVTLILHNYSCAEPWSLTNGTSIWPGVLILVIAILIGIASFWFVFFGLPDYENAVAAKYQLQPESWPTPQPKLSFTERDRKWYDTLVRVLGQALRRAAGSIFRFLDMSKPQTFPSVSICPVLEWEYFEKRQSWQVGRIATPVLLVFIVTLSLWLDPEAMVPARGSLAKLIWAGLSLLAWGLAITLIFTILDRVLLAAGLMKRLALSPTKWPDTLINAEAKRRGVQPWHIEEEMDVRFSGELTESISKAIYLPAIMLMLLVLARSRLFDAWSWSPALLGILALIGFFSVAAAAVLWGSAKSVRKRVLQNLRDYRKDMGNANEESAALDKLVTRLENYDRGAFASLAKQPLVQSLLIPAGGAGALNVLYMLQSWIG